MVIYGLKVGLQQEKIFQDSDRALCGGFMNQ
jgi:hypothetical protein